MISHPVVCVSGTDTDAGKTVFTAGLLRALGSANIRAQAIKAVQTGCSQGAAGSMPDAAVYAVAAPGAAFHTVCSLQRPCSPHLAAEEQREILCARSLAQTVHERALQCTVTIVEGSGGLFVPFNDTETFLDLFDLLDAPVVLSVANRLGAINHALLSLEALASRNIPVLGLVFTETTPTLTEDERIIRQDNITTISRRGRVPVLASIPFIHELQENHEEKKADAWRKISGLLEPLAQQLIAGSSSVKETGSILEFDKKHLWHPYTSAEKPLPVHEAVSTHRNHIFLRNGTRLIDGMASWWAAIHGYNHPHLQRALLQQARQMPHVMFGGLTHAPAVNLGKKLLELAPGGVNRVFFADSGSVSVEVAMKMAVQYHQATGNRDKTACMTFSGGYHGDTLGAMSVCDPVNGMHSLFQRILPKQIFVDRPRCAFHAAWQPESITSLENSFKEHASSVAAFILEPVAQGAGGMWFYHPEYLRRVKSLCQEHNVLLIADEIATGFGRTGKMFACEWGEVLPDILCVGKALTGGVMSLAATLATDRVALGISRKGGVLMHGPTFMANPLACAVACGSLDLLAEGAWQQDVPRIERLLGEGLAPCKGLPGVADVRILGAIGVLEMDAPVNEEALQRYFVEKWRVWIRPFGRLIYVMPPYVSCDEDIVTLTAAMRGAVEGGRWK